MVKGVMRKNSAFSKVAANLKNQKLVKQQTNPKQQETMHQRMERQKESIFKKIQEIVKLNREKKQTETPIIETTNIMEIPKTTETTETPKTPEIPIIPTTSSSSVTDFNKDINTTVFDDKINKNKRRRPINKQQTNQKQQLPVGNENITKYYEINTEKFYNSLKGDEKLSENLIKFNRTLPFLKYKKNCLNFCKNVLKGGFELCIKEKIIGHMKKFKFHEIYTDALKKIVVSAVGGKSNRRKGNSIYGKFENLNRTEKKEAAKDCTDQLNDLKRLVKQKKKEIIENCVKKFKK